SPPGLGSVPRPEARLRPTAPTSKGNIDHVYRGQDRCEREVIRSLTPARVRSIVQIGSARQRPTRARTSAAGPALHTGRDEAAVSSGGPVEWPTDRSEHEPHRS